MNVIDTKISRHEDPRLLKVEFVGAEDTVMISMRGAGVTELTNEEAVDQARRVMSGVFDETKQNPSAPEQNIDSALASDRHWRNPRTIGPLLTEDDVPFVAAIRNRGLDFIG